MGGFFMLSCYIVSGNAWNFKKIDKDFWELQEDVMYALVYKEHTLNILVPKMFKYDLASVPSFFQKILGKKETLACEAALLHDWIYKTNCVSRKDGDLAFLKLMERYNNPKSAWKRWAMYRAVRLFGGKPYKNKT